MGSGTTMEEEITSSGEDRCNDMDAEPVILIKALLLHRNSQRSPAYLMEADHVYRVIDDQLGLEPSRPREIVGSLRK